MGEGVQKGPTPTSFFSITFTNVGISSPNVLTFSFNPFATIVYNIKGVFSASPKLMNFEPIAPLNKLVFSGQILVKLSL